MANVSDCTADDFNANEFTLTIHTCFSVRGMLHTYTKRDWERFGKMCCTPPATSHQAKEEVLELLSQGVEYLPIGEPCTGFSSKTGCPGHRRAGRKS